MYASNCPVSRPVGYRDWKADADFNGMQWSNKYGYMFEVEDEVEPLRLPPVRRGGRLA